MNIHKQVNQLLESRPGAESIRAASSFDQAEAIELYPGIYMSQGTSNSYMLVGDTHRIIINTGMGFEAITHKRLFDEVSTLPTSHIIATQGHVDHLGGVAQFKDTDTLLVAQALNPQCQQDDARIAPLRQSQSYVWFSDVIDQALEVAKDHPEVFVQDKPEADVLFEESFEIDFQSTESLGKAEKVEKIELIALHGGETLDSLAVYLPEQGIVFSGNTFGPLFPHFPNFNTIRGDKYRYVEDYLKALESIQALKPKVLITGHGMPIEGQALIDASLERLKNAVNFIHQQTLDRMNQGQPIHQIMQELKLPDELLVGEGYGRVQWAIRTFWESYIGWFKLSSTTELLATPISAIYSDLCELMDVNALIEKVKVMIGSQELEKALQLVSIYDDSQTEQIDSEAKTELQALKKLLLESLLEREKHNFWFKGWIENQLKQLKQ